MSFVFSLLPVVQGLQVRVYPASVGRLAATDDVL